jgi:hypothetical protein
MECTVIGAGEGAARGASLSRIANPRREGEGPSPTARSRSDD